MSCNQCVTTIDQSVCSYTYPMVSPCLCDDPAPIREEGPQGNQGSKGATPHFAIGSVQAGDAAISIESVSDTEKLMNITLPAVPEGMAYEWTRKNTFSAQAEFKLGLETTGGISTFGGVSFAVTPDATFSGVANVAGNSDVQSNVSVMGNYNEDGQLTVEGDSTFANVEFFFKTDISGTTMTLPETAEYIKGLTVLGSCLDPELQSNVPAGKYTKGEATGLASIPSGNFGPICDPFTINVPVSTCLPQVTPLVDLFVRVGYRFGSVYNFNSKLFRTVGMTDFEIEYYTQGAGFNGDGGCYILRTQVGLTQGDNTFYVWVENNDVTAEDFIPTDVTFWFQN